jgi:hypothetical protein
MAKKEKMPMPRRMPSDYDNEEISMKKGVQKGRGGGGNNEGMERGLALLPQNNLGHCRMERQPMCHPPSIVPLCQLCGRLLPAAGVPMPNRTQAAVMGIGLAPMDSGVCGLWGVELRS